MIFFGLSLVSTSVEARKIISSAVKISVLTKIIGSQDFITRCAQPGVVKCVGFDQAADIAGAWGENSGILPGTNTVPSLDSNNKSSGNSSLKFSITTSSANSGGSYWTNFSNDLLTQFDSGQEFYVQWRQRFSADYVNMNLQSFGNNGWKQVIIGSGDKPGCNKSNSVVIDNGGFCTSSCTALETVVQNSYHRGMAQMYNSCSGSSSTQNGRNPAGTGPYTGFEEPFLSYDFKLQNAMPAPYCLYSQSASTRFPPAGNCFGYFANEWMTFKVKIAIGQRTGDYFKNSRVELWIAREGQPSTKVVNWGPWDLAAGNPVQNLKYGKIWLLPYNTNNGGNNSAAITPAYTWYDELVISTNDIADP